MMKLNNLGKPASLVYTGGMADMWSGLGNDLSKAEGVWLYRRGGDVCGPLPQKALVKKLLDGDIDLHTQVAREGTDFHPLSQVQAFARYVPEAQTQALLRARRRARKRLLWLVLGVALLLGGAGLLVHQEYARRLTAHKARLQTMRRAELAAQQAAQQAAVDLQRAHTMPLVALVSLGDERDIRIHGGRSGHAASQARPAHKIPASAGRQAITDGTAVEGCGLSQNDIFTPLKAALSKINVCVEDEKKRDTQGLLPDRLELQFVVRPSGKVSHFAIDDRHYRTGPLNNCMIKAFNMMTFPTSTGANCPVTIPIKIGK